MTTSPRKAFWGVMLSFTVHGLVVATWVSRIASVKFQLALSDGALGLALLGTAIGSLVMIPATGVLVTRYGSRRVVLWSSVGFCLSLIPPALAFNVYSLFVTLLLYGLAAGANDVSMNAQAVGTERLLGTPVMSRFHAMFSLGCIFSSAAGGWVASRGIGPLPHLAGSAAVFLGMAVLGPRLMADTHDPAVQLSVRPKFRQLPASLVVLSIIGFCFLLSEGAMADWIGVYLKQVLGASDGFAPIGYAVFSTAMAVFRLGGDAITLRIGRAAVIRYGGVLAAAGVAFSILVPSPGLALIGFAAAGAGFSSIIPVVFAAGGRVPSVGEGAGVAAVSGIGYLGFLVGPPAIGFLSEAASLRVGLGLVVVLSLVGAFLVKAVERGAQAGESPLR